MNPVLWLAMDLQETIMMQLYDWQHLPGQKIQFITQHNSYRQRTKALIQAGVKQ